MTKLYTNDGKRIRVWIVDHGYDFVVISYGVLGGSLIYKKSTIPKTKTPKQHAEFLIEKKINSGYVRDLKKAGADKVDIHGFPKFMLAKKDTSKIEYPSFIQPKFNGVRASLAWSTVTEGEGMFELFVDKPVFRSKSGIQYGMERISNYICNHLGRDFFNYDGCDIIFDGELYIHKKPVNVIKSSCPFVKNGVVSKSSNDPDQVTFVVYDIFGNKNQARRINMLHDIFAKHELPIYEDIEHFVKGLSHKPCIMLSLTDTTHTLEESKASALEYISHNFEGAIVRNPKGMYAQGKRVNDLCKIKKFSYDYYTIVDIVRKNDEEETAKFVLIDSKGDTFESMPKGSYEVRHDYLINRVQYIGKKAYIAYGELSGDRKVPFHSNVIKIED